ncbi:hypothetical protein K438DRAFT_1864859 [Mycena galopus ATCC 62051]|nr:hypothetical protein K438DRAFT_1864859 [Mycena galopus ATCC 62051]
MAQPTSFSPAGGGPGQSFNPVSALQGPNALQGNALAALIWIRSIPVVGHQMLYLFLRCNSLAALSFYFMETFRRYVDIPSPPSPNSHFAPGPSYCLRTLKRHGRPSYIASTEILCVLVGEALILLRINALYGWERRWVIFTAFLFLCNVGIVTTSVTLSGGSSSLSGSTGILDCTPAPLDVPDVNIGTCTSLAVVCIYFAMIFRKTHSLAVENSMTMWQILWAADLLPTIHVCLKDACAYFMVGPPHEPRINHRELGYAQVGTPSSTRIFLNLKYLSERSSQYNSATWSEFERASVLDFREIVPEMYS